MICLCVVSEDEDDTETESSRSRKQKSNKCTIVWEVRGLILNMRVESHVTSCDLLLLLCAVQGKTERKSFTDWKVKSIPTEVLARELLRRFGVEHYWDLALSETVVEQGEDE